MNGMLLIDKPSGMTSFDVIAVLRKKLRIRKIGHTGTLDPEATGLLLVLAGNATKLVPFMDYAEKEYEAEYVLGYTSDTYDTSGKLTEVPFDKMPEENTILAALQKLTGTLTQVPPKYAAIRVQGKHLYEYAREGKEIEVPSREITVFSHEYLSSEGRIVRVRVRCSSGTYVRSLAHDFGEILGVPAVMGNLRRTSIGRFSVKDALKLEEIPADVRDIRFLTPYEILKDYPYAEWDNTADVIAGKTLKLDRTEDLVMVTHGEDVLAAYENAGNGYYRCKRGLL